MAASISLAGLWYSRLWRCKAFSVTCLGQIVLISGRWAILDWSRLSLIKYRPIFYVRNISKCSYLVSFPQGQVLSYQRYLFPKLQSLDSRALQIYPWRPSPEDKFPLRRQELVDWPVVLSHTSSTYESFLGRLYPQKYLLRGGTLEDWILRSTQSLVR